MIDEVPSAYQVLPEVIVGRNEGQQIISRQIAVDRSRGSGPLLEGGRGRGLHAFSGSWLYK